METAPAQSRPPDNAGFARRWLGPTARKSVWSITDQLTVSGTRFLMTVLVARYCGAQELGYYAIAFSVLIVLIVLQESLLIAPYIVQGRQVEEAERRVFAGRILILHVMIGIGSTLIACIGTAVLFAVNSGFGVTMAAFSAATPTMLLYAFMRRFALAQLSVASALCLDLAVSALQIAGVIALAEADRLTAASVFVTMGAVSALGGLTWLILNRQLFVFRISGAVAWALSTWRFGRWVLGSQQLVALRISMVYWLLPILLSTKSAGIFAGCAVVLTAANPLLIGVANVLEPRAAEAFAQGGRRELLRVARKVTFMITLLLAVYGIGVSVFGEPVLPWLYDDEAFAGLGHLITVLAMVLLMRASRMGAAFGLRAMGVPRMNFLAGMVELFVNLAALIPLVMLFGLVGAAYAMLLTTFIGTALRWWAFDRLLRRRTVI